MNLEKLQESIERIGTGLDPNQDWLPVLFLEKDDHAALVALAIDGGKESKDMCAAAMFTIIRKCNPDTAAFISTSWISSPPIEAKLFRTEKEIEGAFDLGMIPMPSKDPNRKEVVTVVHVSKNQQTTLMVGTIKRSTDKPPEIIKWKIHEPSPTTDVTGRFGDAMKKGFIAADKNGNLDILNKLRGVQKT